MRKTTLVFALAACALAFAAAEGAAKGPATLVVDRDGVECGNADFTSIQAAVDAAQPGDLIRVCPDLYSETVVVDKPLTLKADPDAVEAIDCFQPTLEDLLADQQAIVDPAGDGFSIGFKLEADNVELAGFVVRGASVGVDTGDSFSGYRVHHNLIRLNTLFGMDFGSEGTHQSRVDHNCIRENRWGLVSELDDDSLWAFPVVGDERGEWNARDLRNARIDQNLTFRNTEAGLEAAGPGRREQVTFEHNVSRQDLGGILLQNSTESAILDNEITDGLGNAIVIGGGNERLIIRGNRVPGARIIAFRFLETFIDRFPIPSRNVVVTQNEFRRSTAGIVVNTNNLADSLISENTASENRGNGIILLSGNTRNVIRANAADNNGVGGITALLGATGNRFEQNSMHGNGALSGTQAPGADARDLNPLLNGMLQNVWTGNNCDTDIPAGMICGVG
jgi:Periplasmic copper-binding protein (NosD)